MTKTIEDLIREMPAGGLALLERYCEMRKHEIQNLQTVGRTEDASRRVDELLDEVLGVVQKRLNNPKYICFYAYTCAMHFRKTERAKDFLESIVNDDKLKVSIDMTTVYKTLGYIYSKVYGYNSESKLWAYHMGAIFIAPDNCEFPSSLEDKAACHFHARSSSKLLLMMAENDSNVEDIKKFKEYEDWHFLKLKELVPGLDWEDENAVHQWLMNK